MTVTSPELERLGGLLRFMKINRLRTLEKGTLEEYHRACDRYVQIVAEYDREAVRIGAPRYYQRPAISI